MGFDLGSAQPVDTGTPGASSFDVSSAQPVDASLPSPTRRYGTGKSLDATSGGIVPTGSAEAHAAQSPTAGNNFGENAIEGIGKFDTDALLAARQIYAQATGGDQSKVTTPLTGQTAADKRKTDQPLAGTWGGKAGMVAGALPLAFIPGANSYAGATALGGSLGALQPTVGDESRILNTGVGAGLGIAGKAGGDKIASWATNRAAQPFMGWSQATGNRAAAQAVGVNAAKLNQPAISDAADRFEQVFGAGRNPAVTVPVGQPTSQAITDAEQGLNLSSKKAFWGSSNVSDLMEHLQNGTANAKQLGDISTRLTAEANGEMTTPMGDRAVGRALGDVKEHVEDLIQGSIQDPQTASAYAAARPQYRTYNALINRPTILNSSTGDVNLNALGKYLQKADKSGYTKGGNTSDLYNAARFGQASGVPTAPPGFSLATPWKMPLHLLMNNPVARAAGGTTARALRPVAPGVSGTTRGLLLEGPSATESSFSNR